jgi:hypothetical protein
MQDRAMAPAGSYAFDERVAWLASHDQRRR